MTRPVKRGTFQRSCQTCGWAGTYDTAGRADYAKRRHACEARIAKAARAKAYANRIAQIDRTPKPCLHKVANHQHGTRACYVLDKCRCIPCSRANAAAQNERSRLKAYGRYDKYTDAQPVREHLARLMDYGIGLKRAGELSGVSTGSLTKIFYGTYASIDGPSRGRYGKGDFKQGPAKRVLHTTAERVLAVQPVPENLAPSALDPYTTNEARTKLRALVALGWSQRKIAPRLGMNDTNFTRVVHADSAMERGTVTAVLALYDELSMTLPPTTTHYDRAAVTRSRNYAKARGWLAPLDLEVEGMDFLGLNDGLDEAAIQRRLDGDRSVVLTVPERREMVTRLHRWGLSMPAMSRRTGYPNRTLSTDHRGLGLTPNPIETRAPIPATGGKNRKRAA